MGRIDLTGQRFGRLVVKHLDEKRILECKEQGRYATYWICECDCGSEKSIEVRQLRNGKTKSCGCYRKDYLSELKTKDLTNMKFGRLTALEIDKSYTRRIAWICQCECGNYKTIESQNLTRGLTTSCGCYFLESRSGGNSHLWNGGTSELYLYLRKCIKKWKLDSLNSSNYKCMITGSSKDLIVHHIHPFINIIRETLNELGLDIKKEVREYSDEELKDIEDLVLKKHYEYGLGAVLTSELHMEFHNLYGRGNYGSKQPRK